MTTTTSRPAVSTEAAPARATAVRRLTALIRAEVLLLVRNRTTLFNAIALGPLIVVFLGWTAGDAIAGDAAADLAGTMLGMLIALALSIVVYYNLTTTFVARREELVLKRLLTGDVSRGEIIAAYAAPAVLITVAQLVLAVVAMAIWLDLPQVQNVLWLAVALVGGVVVFTLLAVASSGLTRTVETAQLTTMPILVVATALSGIVVPLHILPEIVEQVAQWTPMYPVVALIQHGLGNPALDGTIASGAFADVQQPLAALALWVVLGILAARRWMRWEPRR
ncbi:ABC transporter permease [Georgenia sunbinii]|uniref:ABC transporter permease n=1 Tax=Georgenia sunbinii TaxID=3117728 RepID=UPI002F2621AD